MSRDIERDEIFPVDDDDSLERWIEELKVLPVDHHIAERQVRKGTRRGISKSRRNLSEPSE